MKTAKYSKALTVALRPEAFDQINEITDAEHISMAEWVRDAVAAALTTNQQEEDVNND